MASNSHVRPVVGTTELNWTESPNELYDEHDRSFQFIRFDIRRHVAKCSVSDGRVVGLYWSIN